MNKEDLNKTQAILYLIERETPQPQLEHPEEGDELYFKYPPKLFCPEDSKIYLLDTMLEECKHCKSKKNCPIWKP